MVGRLLILGVLDVETNFRARIDALLPLNFSLGRPLATFLFDVNAWNASLCPILPRDQLETIMELDLGSIVYYQSIFSYS